MRERVLIYKICTPEQWEACQETGVFLGAPIDLADGYIHFSTALQLSETLQKHFTDYTALLLVAVRWQSLGEALKWEPSRGGDLFPHLYRPLCVEEAQWVVALAFSEEGNAYLPKDLEHGLY